MKSQKFRFQNQLVVAMPVPVVARLHLRHIRHGKARCLLEKMLPISVNHELPVMKVVIAPAKAARIASHTPMGNCVQK
jgi:hypothetical protein